MIIPNGPLIPPRAAMTLAPRRPRRLVFAGEAIVDVLMRVPGLPPRGGDLLATSSQVTVGGGFNVMAAAARQGLPVLYAGGHGTGPWGDLVRAALAASSPSPMASAVRIVSAHCATPRDTAITSVATPFSFSRTASSTAISSNGFIDIFTPDVSMPEPSALTRTFTL